jgi:hypothetical protein
MTTGVLFYDNDGKQQFAAVEVFGRGADPTREKAQALAVKAIEGMYGRMSVSSSSSCEQVREAVGRDPDVLLDVGAPRKGRRAVYFHHGEEVLCYLDDRGVGHD